MGRPFFYSVIMKNFLLVAFALLSGLTFSQEGGWCGTNKIIEEKIQSDPSYKEHLHDYFINVMKGQANSEAKSAAITVPVVVHVIHDNGVGNISVDQITSALDILNLDYQRMNADTSATRNTVDAPFKPVAGGMDIEFRLAKIDPQGNCTNGIVRVNAPHLTYDADEDCKFDINGGSSAWPSDKYFNIWVVNSIDNGGDPGIIAGYAWYPNNISSNPGYGILIRHDYTGNIGTALYNDGRVLTHEMGHALGLPHIFDPGFGGVTGCHSTDCGTIGDYVCDTPPQTEANWSCSPTWNSCDSVPVNDAFGYDVVDQIENYMSYNSCQNMFSLGQVDRMQNNFLTVPELMNMITPANIIATGAMQADQLCMAEFESYNKIVCSGTFVEFFDFSYTGQTSWQWSATPGTVGVDYTFVNGTSSTDQNPVMAFLTPGDYDITLTVTDGVGSQTQTKAGYIKVLPNYSTLPILEGFEPYTNLAQTDYWVTTSSIANNEFDIITGVGHSGNRCVKLENFNESAGNRDELQSSTVDLSWLDPNNDNITLSFRYAYRKRSAGNDEWLKVYITANCGENWVQRKTIHGDMLSSLTNSTPWTPSAESDWTTVHMTNITSNFFTESFRYKFAFESDGGNNFYIDDINIYQGAPSDQLVSVNELDEQLDFVIYPNPTDGELNLEFTLMQSEYVNIEVCDIAGKQIKRNFIQASSGRNIILMDSFDLSSGTYLISVNTSTGKRTERVIIN